ncbi:MAG: hypothetical protein JWM95_4355 [Gemmatimonadetes bacterium]|nr:hypothetical protein [Gemmatimonadota bacterium]
MQHPNIRWLSALGLICSFGATVPASGQEQGPFDPKTGLYGTAVTVRSTRAPDTLYASPSKIWNSLVKIYAEFGVPLTVADTSRSVLGAIRVNQRKPIAGKRLSMLLECGSSAYGENADRYAVKLTWLTHVEELEDKRSVLEMRVSGDASPLGMSSTVTCASTGKLEELVAAALKKAAAS